MLSISTCVHHELTREITQRREALSRLLVLIRSEHTSVKLEGARLLGYFFADFPDLQEKVVDAVYDLCEDPDPDVCMRTALRIAPGPTVTDRLIGGAL
jgi:hypothetical protein